MMSLPRVTLRRRTCQVINHLYLGGGFNFSMLYALFK